MSEVNGLVSNGAPYELKIHDPVGIVHGYEDQHIYPFPVERAIQDIGIRVEEKDNLPLGVIGKVRATPKGTLKFILANGHSDRPKYGTPGREIFPNERLALANALAWLLEYREHIEKYREITMQSRIVFPQPDGERQIEEDVYGLAKTYTRYVYPRTMRMLLPRGPLKEAVGPSPVVDMIAEQFGVPHHTASERLIELRFCRYL